MADLKALLIPVLGVAVFLTSCETTEQKKHTATPPQQAGAPTLSAPSEPQTVSAGPAPAHSHSKKKNVPVIDPVDALIARVESEYQAGQANYNAGHPEAAKDNFDRAFNILLQGPPEVHSDERLEQEFDKLVERVHELELLALKQGDGFTQEPAEPAPIDEANEVTFPVDPNIRAKAEEEIKTTQSDLPLVLNDPVASYISYFSNGGRHSLEHGYIRSGRYREMISRILQEEGVPQDLIYLAQAESGFHPMALSKAGARGMWQFMASRGSGYGLQRNFWVDDRQDPEKSTRAAAKHLKDLYAQFGDWYLVMAAYNSGPGTVQRAVQRTGYADYWELYRRGVLPAETRNYVPIILAITIMSKNPAQYGLDRLHPDEPVRYDTVKIDYPVDLRLVSECTDVSISTLQELNPSLTRTTTPRDQKFALHVPEGTAAKYEENIAAIPEDKRLAWHYHKIAQGDTLAAVAKRYHTSTQAIAEANDLNGDDLGGKARLVVPAAPVRVVMAASSDSNRPAASSSRSVVTRYKVRRGDTIASVAESLGVSAASLRKWNHIKGNSLKAGKTLTIQRIGGDSEENSRESASSSRKSRAKLVAVSDTDDDVSNSDSGACTKWVHKGKGRRAKRVCVAHAKAKKNTRSDDSDSDKSTRQNSKRSNKRSEVRSNRRTSDDAEDEAPAKRHSSSKRDAAKPSSSKHKRDAETADRRKSSKADKAEKVEQSESASEKRKGSKKAQTKKVKGQDSDSDASESRHHSSATKRKTHRKS